VIVPADPSCEKNELFAKAGQKKVRDWVFSSIVFIHITLPQFCEKNYECFFIVLQMLLGFACIIFTLVLNG